MAKFQTKRLTVTVHDEVDIVHDFDGLYVSDVIKRLQAIQEKQGAHAKFCADMESDYGESDSYLTCYITSTHPETDGEYEARRERHNQHEQNKKDAAKTNRKFRDDKDKRDYARLKKKFEKK